MRDERPDPELRRLRERCHRLEKQVADLRTDNRNTKPVRCPECKYVFQASIGDKNDPPV